MGGYGTALDEATLKYEKENKYDPVSRICGLECLSGRDHNSCISGLQP